MNKRLSLNIGLLAFALTAILVVSLAFPALAAPPAQGDLLPTPTLFPVETAEYTMYEYGGTDDPQTFTHAPLDGFTFTDTTARTFYPAGMEFTVGIESEGGEITSVQWVLRREETFGTRVSAEWDATREMWVAHPWEAGGQAAGTEGYFHWQAKDAAGNTVETEPQFVIYWDPNNVWYRMESDQIVMHWYGIGDDPDAFARGMAEFLAAVYPRWVAGFGRGLSYKPLALIYPDANAYAARFLGGIVSANQGGVTVPGEGLTTQRIRQEYTEPIISECKWTRPAEFWTFERRVHEIYTTVAHEFTHLYQGDLGVSSWTWWTEGQAEYFSNGTPEYAEERLHYLATVQDMPTLQAEVGYQTNEADGCYRLAYDAGASFVNWLLTTYGGIDTHRQIVELMIQGQGLEESIAQVTGKPFLEIENGWRAYHGYRAFTPAEIDPSLAMQDYEDPVLKVGDTVVVPPDPPIAMIFKDPAPNALASGSCWANMELKILQIGQLNDVIYVKVDCMGQVGWMTRDQLIAPGG